MGPFSCASGCQWRMIVGARMGEAGFYIHMTMNKNVNEQISEQRRKKEELQVRNLDSESHWIPLAYTHAEKC